MKTVLSAVEARVVGCLLEKQITTPEQYPMSLNGVLTACNQKSNREPVMTLDESVVQSTLDLLVKKHLATALSGAGNRVVKYEHRFCNTAFGQLKLTPGELRIRSARLHNFVDVAEVEQALENLASREDGPFVVQLAREPGKREHRYMHLFSGRAEDAVPAENPVPESDLISRVSELEREMRALKEQLTFLQNRMN